MGGETIRATEEDTGGLEFSVLSTSTVPGSWDSTMVVSPSIVLLMVVCTEPWP